MRWAAVLVLALVAPSAHGLQPSRPDFSGLWIFNSTTDLAPAVGRTDRTDSPVPKEKALKLNPSFGLKFTARQSASALVLERDIRGQILTTTYSLTGKESKNVELIEETVSVATWKQSRLEILTRDTSGRELRRVMWLDPEGALIVETRVRDLHYATKYIRGKNGV